jgi:hypothetical protein
MANGRVSFQGLLSCGEALAAKSRVFRRVAEEETGGIRKGNEVISRSFVVRAGALLKAVRRGDMKKYEFRDAPFMSAREKELVLKAWVRFLRKGLKFEDFTRRLYEHLHLHCQFIAHYDRAGFYQTYFERGEDTVKFLSQFDRRGECRSVEYGMTNWLDGDYGDLARAMIEEASGFIPHLMEDARARQHGDDIAEAQRLLAKHGHELRL